jgi:mannose-6-phosphate isomerase-like protein (cupin superfamily)
MTYASEIPAVLRTASEPGEHLRQGFTRRIIRTCNLMTVVLDIEGGPWALPDPHHYHPHEQTCYVAAGEVLFLAEGSAPERLSAGDCFAVPPNIPHSIQLLSETARLVDTFHPIREDFLK